MKRLNMTSGFIVAMVSVVMSLVACGTTKPVVETTTKPVVENASKPIVEAATKPVFEIRRVTDTPSEQTIIKPIFKSKLSVGERQQYFIIEKIVLSDQLIVKQATATYQANIGKPVLRVDLTPAGAKALEELTRNNINKRLAIMVGDKLISAPIVTSAIAGGTFEISGGLSIDDVKTMALEINKSVQK
jgi:preprotein translocase subunit SecD